MLHCTKCGRSYPAGTQKCPQDGSALRADRTVASSSVEPSSESLIGLILDDKYQLDEPLGRGGMGTVYRATHLLIDRPVAVKVLNPRFISDEAAHERFRREARAAGRLRHTNAVAVTDFGETPEGIVYIVMELLEGESLRELLAREAPLSPALATQMMIQASGAVAAAHETGIIHRDLKPGNIFIVQRPNAPPIIKVLDFGIAKLATESGDANQPITLTETGIMIGTPRYMSPEQCDGRPLTPASDVYSLGIILYEMLTGVTPFTGPSPLSIALKHSSEAPKPPREIVSSLPPALEQIVLHALEKIPENRPADAGELARELRTAAESLGFDHIAGFSPPTMELLRGAGTETPSGRLVIDFERLRQTHATGSVSDVAPTTAENESASATAEELAIKTSGAVQSKVAEPSSPEISATKQTIVAPLNNVASNIRSRLWIPISEGQRWNALLQQPAFLIGALVLALLAFVSIAYRLRAPAENINSADTIGRMDESGAASEQQGAGAPSPVANPQSAEDFIARGGYFASQRNFDAAISDYRQAIALESNNPLAHNRLGMALLMKNQFAEAAQEFRTALEQRGGSYPTAQFNLGYALQRRAMRDNNDELNNEAVNAYMTAISQRSGNYPDAYYQIGLIRLTQHRDAEAVDALRRAIQQNNGRDPEAHYYLGISLLRQRYFDEAEAAFRSTIEQRGRKTPDAHLMLGGLYEETNRLADAIREYETYLQQPNAPNRRDVDVRLRGLRSRQQDQSR
jgi:eukaryotic-like serine/threonine-protein kinase